MIRRPIHPFLVPIPIVCFVGALLTDLTYWGTAEMMWADFSAWLISIGLVTGVLVAIAGLAEYFRDRRAHALRPVWPHVLGEVLVLALAFFDTMIHSRDAWTSVVPMGLILSAAVVAVAFATGWMGCLLARRRTIEVIE